MFGYTLIKTKELDDLISKNDNQFFDLVRLKEELRHAHEENNRLFNFHNKRLTKPKKDKNGVLRNPDGTFAKK